MKKAKQKERITKEEKIEQAEPEAKKKRVIEGDCRKCMFFTIPVNTGQSETARYRTQNYTVTPCGVGKCEGKKFMSREDYEKQNKGE